MTPADEMKFLIQLHETIENKRLTFDETKNEFMTQLNTLINRQIFSTEAIEAIKIIYHLKMTNQPQYFIVQSNGCSSHYMAVDLEEISENDILYTIENDHYVKIINPKSQPQKKTTSRSGDGCSHNSFLRQSGC